MAGTSGSSYFVDRTGKAALQIQQLHIKARTIGKVKALRTILQDIHQRLRSDPQGWGKPLYHTKLPGGTVFCGILPPLVVHFVVYEPERFVWIFDVKALPSSPMAL